MLFLYFPVWKFGFVNFSRGLFREYLFHTTQLISWLPFVRKIQTECEFSEPTEQQQFVCGRVVPAKDVRIRVRAFRNDRNWREKTKYSIQSTRCHVCRRGASPCLIVSSLILPRRRRINVCGQANKAAHLNLFGCVFFKVLVIIIVIVRWANQRAASRSYWFILLPRRNRTDVWDIYTVLQSYFCKLQHLSLCRWLAWKLTDFTTWTIISVSVI